MIGSVSTCCDFLWTLWKASLCVSLRFHPWGDTAGSQQQRTGGKHHRILNTAQSDNSSLKCLLQEQNVGSPDKITLIQWGSYEKISLAPLSEPTVGGGGGGAGVIEGQWHWHIGQRRHWQALGEMGNRCSLNTNKLGGYRGLWRLIFHKRTRRESSSCSCGVLTVYFMIQVSSLSVFRHQLQLSKRSSCRCFSLASVR